VARGAKSPVSEITKEKFDSLNLPDKCRALWSPSLESNWFSDDSGAVLGVIHYSPATKFWGYVMYVRVARDVFKPLGMGSDLTRFDVARRDLVASMERHISTVA
jgi:hypothetical protein